MADHDDPAARLARLALIRSIAADARDNARRVAALRSLPSGRPLPKPEKPWNPGDGGEAA